MVAAATAVSLLLRARSPLWIRSNYIVDYALFGQLAGSLADHQWLGPFDGRNLLKGPSYSMFIYASYLAHVPLVMAEQLLYLLAGGVLCVGLSRLAGSKWLGAGAFVALALNPTHLGAAGSKVIRENVYTSFAILLIGSILLILENAPRLARARYGSGFLVLGVAGPLIGGVGAAYYLCREERPWVVPAAGIAVFAGIWSWRGGGGITLRTWIATVLVLVLAVMGSLAGVAYVKHRNKEVYGVSIISDLVDGQLARAYTVWQSVEAGPRRRHIPVPEAARRAAYAVSPAAAELEPYLEGSTRHWLFCSPRLPACDYLGAFFIWALREAAGDAGHYHSEVAAQNFFKTVADQITSACARNRLRCGPTGLLLAPAITLSDVGPLSRSTQETLSYLMSFDVADPTRIPPSGGLSSTWQVATRAIPEARDERAFQAQERQAMREQQPVRILKALYQWLAYLTIILAVIGLLWELVRPRFRSRALAFAVVAVFVALLSRVAVVAVIDALSYPAARNEEYAVPGADLLVAFCVLGSWIFVEHAIDLYRRLRGRKSGAGEDAELARYSTDGESGLPERRSHSPLERTFGAGDDAVP